MAAGSDQVEKGDLEQAIRLALDVPEGEIMLTPAEQWIEEGREQGLEEAILQALDVGFGPAPAGLVEMVEAVDAPATLRELLCASAATLAGVTDRGYTGHRSNNLPDDDLGHIYMNARYYLPRHRPLRQCGYAGAGSGRSPIV